jgi:pimeloyl-[acyl-carrier protein] synthase
MAIDPYPALRRLRESAPVHYLEALGTYVVTGHAEAREVLRHPDGDLRCAAFQQSRLGDLSPDATKEPYCVGLSEFVLMKSGEDHRRVRAAFARRFTNRQVDQLRDRIAIKAHELIDGFEDRGQVDLLGAFARPLPLAVIGDLLGLSKEDQAAIGRPAAGFMVALEFRPLDDSGLRLANRSIEALNAYFTQLIEVRRASPGDDLLSLLIAEADDGTLTGRELLSNVWGLFTVGHDTTAGGIACALLTLLAHPRRAARRAERPDPGAGRGGRGPAVHRTRRRQPSHLPRASARWKAPDPRRDAHPCVLLSREP